MLFVWGLPSLALNNFCKSLLNHIQFLTFVLTCRQQQRTPCSSNGPPRRRVQRWYNLHTADHCCLVYVSKNPARPFCQCYMWSSCSVSEEQMSFWHIDPFTVANLLFIAGLNVRVYIAHKIQSTAHFSSCCLSSDILRLIFWWHNDFHDSDLLQKIQNYKLAYESARAAVEGTKHLWIRRKVEIIPSGLCFSPDLFALNPSHGLNN